MTFAAAACSPPPQALCEKLLSSKAISLPEGKWRLGKTQVFLRDAATVHAVEFTRLGLESLCASKVAAKQKMRNTYRWCVRCRSCHKSAIVSVGM